MLAFLGLSAAYVLAKPAAASLRANGLLAESEEDGASSAPSASATSSSSSSSSPPPSSSKPPLPPSLYNDTHTTPHSQYFSRLLTLASGPELLSKNLWPDAKEMSESFACSEAFFRFILPHLPSPPAAGEATPGDRVMLVVGDGSTPRTAGLLAYQLSSRGYWAYSIDPQMAIEDPPSDPSPSSPSSPPASPGCSSPLSLGTLHKSITNLLVHRGPIEELYINATHCTVILMHAHVSHAQVLNSIGEECESVTVVSCPCCNYAEGQSRFQVRPKLYFLFRFRFPLFLLLLLAYV